MADLEDTKLSAEPPSRLGPGMIIAGWVVAIGLVAALFGGWLTARQNPNRHLVSHVGAGGVREVVLLQNRQGNYLAPGRINGTPVTFLVDTGATDVTVPADLADRLGLRRGPAVAASTANGTIRTWLTRLDRVELGDISMTDVRAQINPGMGGGEVLLGMSFLRRLELAQGNGRLTLRQPPGGS